MAHVDQAVREMYGAVHMQLLGSSCQLDKLLLACLIMETNAQGAAPAALFNLPRSNCCPRGMSCTHATPDLLQLPVFCMLFKGLAVTCSPFVAAAKDLSIARCVVR